MGLEESGGQEASYSKRDRQGLRVEKGSSEGQEEEEEPEFPICVMHRLPSYAHQHCPPTQEEDNGPHFADEAHRCGMTCLRSHS